MNLETVFNQTVQQYHQANTRIVLALSGGLDSRVMLELMAAYCQAQSVECMAVHVHHGLSPNADRWAQMCQTWCQQLDVEFALEKVIVEVEGKSIEESAREARYAALGKYLQPNDLLLTGQHADDQLETFFLALKRGSGPKGLSSMAHIMPFAESCLVRPLLTVSRQQIEEYAREKQLEWVEDESNQDQRFERNFVRHSITPSLAERWPHIRQSIQRTAELCGEQEQLLDELLADKYQHCLHRDGSLIIDALESLSPAIRNRIIRMWFENLNCRMPSRVQLAQLWQDVVLAQQDANPQYQFDQGQVRRFEQRLYLVKEWQSLEAWSQVVELEKTCVLPDELGEMVVVPVSQGSLSQQALAQGRLSITFNPEGLKAHPVERGHSRKLKKLFQEYGVPSWLRRRTPILLCGDKVVAVGDLFIDRHFIGQDCELIWDKVKRFM